MLRDKEPINKILSYTDKILLKKVLNLEDTDISRLRTIYETLVRRRRKKRRKGKQGKKGKKGQSRKIRGSLGMVPNPQGSRIRGTSSPTSLFVCCASN